MQKPPVVFKFLRFGERFRKALFLNFFGEVLAGTAETIRILQKASASQGIKKIRLSFDGCNP